MTQIDRDVVLRKLERIAEDIRLLEPFRGMTLEVYRADVYRRKAVERLLQEVIEAAVDINSHLIVGSGRPAPDDLHSSFLALAEMGVIDREFAAALAPCAGLRNRLVHEYDRIDDSKVLSAVQQALEQFPAYVARIEAHLAP